MAIKLAGKNITKYNYSPGSGTGRIKYLVIHYLGSLGTAKAACDYYASQHVGASAHYYVGYSGEIWQGVEDKDVAWHCGGVTAYKHPACRNSNSIGIEICVKKRSTKTMLATDKDWYFEDASVKSAIELTKELMKKFGIPAANVLRHYDVTGKICPNPFVYDTGKYTWAAFKAAIADKGTSAVSPDAPSTASPTTPSTATSTVASEQKIGGLTVEAIARYVQAEGGIFSGKNQVALTAIAQCMKDMKEDGRFGKDIKSMLASNFAKPEKTADKNCVQAVKDVFFNGKLRYKDAKILQFRSFTKYSDGKGNMDKQKCASLLKSYAYIGKDSISSQWGHLYFGTKTTAGTKPPPTAAPPVANAPVKLPYAARVGIPDLYIRTGPGIQYPHIGFIAKGTYTIVEEKNGFGKLKSGAGWVSLAYIKKL